MLTKPNNKEVLMTSDTQIYKDRLYIIKYYLKNKYQLQNFTNSSTGREPGFINGSTDINYMAMRDYIT